MIIVSGDNAGRTLAVKIGVDLVITRCHLRQSTRRNQLPAASGSRAERCEES